MASANYICHLARGFCSEVTLWVQNKQKPGICHPPTGTLLLSEPRKKGKYLTLNLKYFGKQMLAFIPPPIAWVIALEVKIPSCVHSGSKE